MLELLDDEEDESPEEAYARELFRLEADLCRRSLFAFVKRAWHVVEPHAEFVSNWHIEELCRVLQLVSMGRIKRVLVNVPPGTMKSLLVSVFWPAWEWTSKPSLRYLCASYSSHLSIRDNGRTRELIQSDWYQARFHVRLGDDQNAKQWYTNTGGGWRFATSVGGAGTGEHPDRIIIDDPHTAQQARSDAERSSANEWFDRTISSRGVTRDTRIVVIMQRLHEQDLSGHLLQKGGWEHICWPMHWDPKRADSRDPRKEAGELLWPSLFTPARVKQLSIDLGPYGAAGQLEQRPAPEGGGLFKVEWLPIIDADAVPAGGTECRGWDTAGTENAGDFTVGTKIKRVGSIFYVMDVRRGQWSPAGVEAAMLQTAQADGRACRIREEQEPGSSGKTVIATRTRQLAGYDYKGVPTTGDKVTRARPFRAQAEAGNVRLVRGSWNQAYIDELCVFPNGTHDDQVDSSSASFNELTLRPALRVVDAAWG